MGRSISRSFDSLLDSVDDPRSSIENTLAEMRQQLRAARREVVGSVAAEKQLRAKVDELARQTAVWAERAELAVRSGDDELARAALQQRRRVEEERERAERLRGDQLAHALEMKGELERMEQRIGEIEARKGALALQVEQARRGAGVEALGAGSSKPFSELRRLEAEIEGVELAVQAQREVDEALRPAGPAGLSSEEVEARFRRLESGETVAGSGAGSSEVEDELQAIKRKFRVGG